MINCAWEKQIVSDSRKKNKEKHPLSLFKNGKEENNSLKKSKSGTITGASASDAMVSTDAFSAFINQAEVPNYNLKYQGFILRSGKING
jgi:hypothetical protein